MYIVYIIYCAIYNIRTGDDNQNKTSGTCLFTHNIHLYIYVINNACI